MHTNYVYKTKYAYSQWICIQRMYRKLNMHKAKKQWFFVKQIIYCNAVLDHCGDNVVGVFLVYVRENLRS